MVISHDAELHELAFISVVYFNISTWERCYCIGLRINIITCKSCGKAVEAVDRKEGCIFARVAGKD